MPISHLFFGFSGRINRGKLWAAVVVFMVLGVFGSGAIVVAWTSVLTPNGLRLPFDFNVFRYGGIGIIVVIVGIAVFVSELAVIVKRLHDRDKSGWWAVVFVVLPWILTGAAVPKYAPGYAFDPAGTESLAGLAAFVLYVWAFIELGCLRGTVGPNRFGTDPLPFYGAPYGTPPPYPYQSQPPPVPPVQQPPYPGAPHGYTGSYPGQAHPPQPWPRGPDGPPR